MKEKELSALEIAQIQIDKMDKSIEDKIQLEQTASYLKICGFDFEIKNIDGKSRILVMPKRFHTIVNKPVKLQ